MLETGNFPQPVSRSDSEILIETLFDFHWRELNEPLVQRLWNLVNAKALDALAEIKLRLHLYSFEQRVNDFVDLWMAHFHGRTIIHSLAMKCAGDLRISDKRIISDLIAILRASIPWGTKHRAMIALGRIGPPSGEEAAQTIRDVVYDSSPEISKQRGLVVKRIQTAPENWLTCGSCHNGMVESKTYYGVSIKQCENCCGLGFVWQG